MPKVSVIIAIYNAEKTLNRAIDSVLCQTFKEIEIILINDGSTDGTQDIISQYALKDSRIKVYHQSNSGVAIARQRGLDISTGDYFIFVDADDWIEKDTIELLYYACIKEKSKISICDYRSISNHDTKIVIQKPDNLYSQDLINGILNGKLLGGVCNKLISKTLLEGGNIQFEENINYCEDVLFLAKICNNNFFSISYISKPLYNYDKSECNSITSGKFTKDKYISFRKFIDKLKENYALTDLQYAYIIQDLSLKTFANNILTRKEFYKDFNKEKHLIKFIRMNSSIKFLIWLSMHGFFPESFKIYKLYLKIRS